MRVIVGNPGAGWLVLLATLGPAGFLIAVGLAVARLDVLGVGILGAAVLLVVFSRQCCVAARGVIVSFYPPSVIRCHDRPTFLVEDASVACDLVASVGAERVRVLHVPIPPWNTYDQIEDRVALAAQRLDEACS